MSAQEFDFAIIGAGAAGLQLALRMAEDSYFHDKKILILDKYSKTENDKTWCFWEIGEGRWDTLLTKTWKTALFHGQGLSKQLELEPYIYKMLRSADFYQYAKDRLSSAANIEWVVEEVIEVNAGESPKIQTQQSQYSVSLIFDSRLPKSWETDQRSLKLYQHFRGWRIKSEQAAFDPSAFTMMDYRLGHENNCSFTYILPLSSTEALVEYTFFTPDLRGRAQYDDLLTEYLSKILKLQDYSILEVEEGVIPMTNYPFDKHHEKGLIKIGAAGGWVKASTGYSFRNAGKMVELLIRGIKNNTALAYQPAKRYKLYDSTLLHVLQNANHKGPQLFTDLYTKNPIQRLFRFLDEESSFKDELAVMASVDKVVFGKAFMKELFR